jgi:hypothetical protein
VVEVPRVPEEVRGINEALKSSVKLDSLQLAGVVRRFKAVYNFAMKWGDVGWMVDGSFGPRAILMWVPGDVRSMGS